MKNLFGGNFFDSNFDGEVDMSDIYNLYRLTTDGDEDEDSNEHSNEYSGDHSNESSEEDSDVDEKNDSEEDDVISTDILQDSDKDEPQFFTAYKSMRQVLIELEEGSKIKEKVDEYNLLVAGMIFYSVNKFTFNGCLSNENKKVEFVLLIKKFEIECTDMDIENLFDIMSEHGDWYSLSEYFCKYKATDIGNFWEVVYLMSKLCKSQKKLNEFIASYLDFIKKLSFYLSLKYSEIEFISQAHAYLNDLVKNLRLYVKNN